MARTKKNKFDDLADTPRMKICEQEECFEPGEYRAPKLRMVDRGGPQDYQWLCLSHIREFNKSWNFFDGMSDTEVLNYKNEDITGHRPTWKLGSRAATSKRQYTYDDPFDFNTEAEFKENGRRKKSGTHETNGQFPDKEHRDALATLNLNAGCSLKEIKKRHKELVKKHHPDLNGGDKSAEEVMKNINQAYTHLLNYGTS